VRGTGYAPPIEGAHKVPSFSTTLEQSIHGALALANARRHELATLEHLLLALIDEPDASRVLQALETDVEGSEAVPTAAFQRVIQRAAIHVQSSGRTEVTGANVLVAIFAERESNAAYFLQEQDMTRYDVPSASSVPFPERHRMKMRSTPTTAMRKRARWRSTVSTSMPKPRKVMSIH